MVGRQGPNSAGMRTLSVNTIGTVRHSKAERICLQYMTRMAITMDPFDDFNGLICHRRKDIIELIEGDCYSLVLGQEQHVMGTVIVSLLGQTYTVREDN